MGNINSNLNIFICGNTLNEENKNIINNLFPKSGDSLRLDDSEYSFRIREIQEKKNDINFNINWKCFILDKIMDLEMTERLINHIKNLTERNKEKEIEYHNVILYFSDANYINIVRKILEKKGEITKEYEGESKIMVEQKIPFVIIFGNSKRDDTNILRHINYLPNSNYKNDIDNIKKKLIAIDAYYNEKGTLYKDLSRNSFTSLSIKVLLIGKAGAGKSTFINTSFGELVARSSPSMKSVTSKCTEYLLPYKIDEKCKGRIMLIDTPGFENKQTVKLVINEIKKYTKNAKDSKDMVHCVLFFLKEGDRINPYEEEIFDYIFEQKLELFFVITRSNSLENKTRLSIKDHFKDKIKEENIINTNLVKQKILISKKKNKTQEIPIIGIEDIYEAILKFLKPEIYNDELFNSLKSPKTIEDKLKILQKISFLFKEFNSIEDLKKGSHTKGNKIVATTSSLAGACGFIPFPFADIIPVLSIQIGMILGLANLYGIDREKYNIKDIILSGGCTLGDVAVNASVQSAMDLTKQGFKTVFKEAAEEVIDDTTEQGVKAIVKEVLKEGGQKSSSAVKFIPGIGTLIGGLVSASINAGFTASMGKGTMKLFEDKLLGDDNGYTFLINRIKSYQNIFNQFKYYSEKEDWDFEEWEE